MQTTVEIPLLQDHHSHPLFYSAFGQSVSLESAASKPEALQRLESAWEHPAANGPGITIAHGWRSNHFQWTAEEIEKWPPTAIFNVSLHDLVINRGGMQVLVSRYGSISEQLRDRIWYENNLRVVLNWFANLNASPELLTQFYDQMLEQGVYFLEEMLLVDENEIELFKQAGLIDRTRFWAAPDTFESLSAPAKLDVHGLKLFTDGALGARTAALIQPYLDSNETENRGLLIHSDAELTQQITACLATRKSLAIHAIGDRAIEQVIESLTACENAIYQAPEIRIEHAQLISRNAADRAKDLGVTLSMQPNFSHDSVDYADRMSAEYRIANNPFRMLIDEVGFVAGEDLVFGSDGMPHGMEAAITQSLSPSLSSQQLSLDEFVAGYCMEDESLGTIEIEIEVD
ncbi:MAG: putative amidohydrolase YtcJ [Mariniblastus sp.]|jgi:predicted amidohydrolase YtcJ